MPELPRRPWDVNGGKDEVGVGAPAPIELADRASVDPWAWNQETNREGPRTGADQDLNVIETKPTPREREPRLIYGLLGAEQKAIHWDVGGIPACNQPHLARSQDVSEDRSGERCPGLRVDADRCDIGRHRYRGRAIAAAVSDAPHDTLWPAGLARASAGDRAGGDAEVPEGPPGAFSPGGVFAATLLD